MQVKIDYLYKEKDMFLSDVTDNTIIILVSKIVKKVVVKVMFPACLLTQVHCCSKSTVIFYTNTFCIDGNSHVFRT
jgi:hypothetical protein